MKNRLKTALTGALAAALLCAVLPVPGARASDHADPIDLWNRERLEGGITDLFFFPDGDNMVVILCVRRALTQTSSLELTPYTYSVHMDLRSTVVHWDAAAPAPQTPEPGPTLQEYTWRYGGKVERPDAITPTVTISFRLMDDATLAAKPLITGLPLEPDDERIVVHAGAANDYFAIDDNNVNVWTGVADDPFIFPVFFKTNVVAMVMTIPRSLFPAAQEDWILWADSRIDDKQIDHVGRSLRTQNPRFELYNTLPPSQQPAASLEEHEHPSLMRDLFLRIGLNSIFAYRAWDHVPDVMLFTTEEGLDFGVRREDGTPVLSNGDASYPNGRRLEDDVAARLARYGDTLLYEISYIAGGWPRATQNDNAERQPDGTSTLPRDEFPYLAKPWPDRDPPEQFKISMRNKLKLAGLAVAVLALWLFTAWLLAAWLDRRRQRRRFL